MFSKGISPERTGNSGEKLFRFLENCEKTGMGVFHSVKKQFYKENPAQMKRELAWLWGRVKANRGKIAVIGLLGLCGTVMSLVSSVASKYLIDAVTGFGTDVIGR